MALNPGISFVGRITAPSTAYPYGSSQNETSAGAGDGTPYNLTRANDIFGFQQALLKAAAIVPSGNADQVGASQYLQAVVTLASGGAGYYTDSGAANAYVLSPQTDREAPGVYFNGMLCEFIVNITNTGASTVNVASLGSKNIKMPDGTDLSGGTLFSGQRVLLMYDGTNFIFIGARGQDGAAAPLSFAFAADADDTLTAAENLYSRIEIAGSTLTATRALSVSGAPRNLSIKNGEGQAVTVKGTSGISVPSGASLDLYFDGTNVVIPEDYFTNGTIAISKYNVLATLAQAWINFDGSGTPTTKDSYNVSSITDNGTGSWVLNLTNPLPSTNCAVVGSAVYSLGITAIMATVLSTTTIEVRAINQNGGTTANIDATDISVVVFANP